MSLLSIRRERREQHRGPHKPPLMWKLLLGLAVVAVVVWYLGQLN